MATGLLTLYALKELPAKKFDSEEQRFDYVFTLMDVDGSGFLDEREITSFVRIVRRLGGMVPDFDRTVPVNYLGFPVLPEKSLTVRRNFEVSTKKY